MAEDCFFEGWEYTPAPYETDKFLHGYMPVYARLAKELGPESRVLELGVHGGGSLATWLDWYPGGVVIGLDIDPNSAWPEGVIKIIASQHDPGLPKMLAREGIDALDLIIDDCSHNGYLTEHSFTLLWPLVRPGGYYVIEDWFTGYAGCVNTDHYNPEMLDLARGMIDRLKEFGGDTESIEYRYGMMIIKKATPRALDFETLVRFTPDQVVRYSHGNVHGDLDARETKEERARRDFQLTLNGKKIDWSKTQIILTGKWPFIKEPQ